VAKRVTAAQREAAALAERERVEGELLAVGLRVGDRVRWRRATGGSWLEGTVERRERDGSIGVRDGRGSARALPLDRLEVKGKGPRGGLVWEPVTERAQREEQLGMW
jgi:hypothetical protein